MWAISIGLVALVVRRHVRAGAERFTPGLAARIFGAWLAGVVGFFILFALIDLSALP